MTSEHAQPQRIQRMATIYLEAAQWADQVYASANGQTEN
jgi:EAL and modified HD-GYP domain-containing signal transduction protein